MNFLRIENNKKSTVLTTLSVLLPFTFVYKLSNNYANLRFFYDIEQNHKAHYEKNIIFAKN